MTRWLEGIVQITEPDGVVDLGPGHLDPALLPTDLLRTAYADAFDDYGPAGLTYGENQGPLPLREALAKRVTAADGVPCHADQVVITAGTSTTLDLLARWAVPAADTVVADTFAYDYGMRVFTERGLAAVRVPADADGMDPAALDEALASHRDRVALLYLLPTFHNPTGLVLPEGRRLELIAVARRHGVRIVEDDAYADVVLGSPPPTSVAGLAGYRGVLRLGTFSKSLAPGLRLGWLATDAATAKGLAESAAFSSGGGLNHLAAVAVAGLLESGAYDRHVAWLREEFRQRRDALVSTLRALLPPEFRFTTPDGGFFLWITLPDGVTEEAAVAAAARAGAPVSPGSRFGRGAAATIRLSWSFHGPDALTEGARRLARALVAPGPR
ncbi:MAG TPA: aminotransferase class I/II-fold pyridoxal phosphate-dependent enzyme [Umezawaea sp.]|nr:aminotransferase class I/II-fold pyridoxal phosphate-dependent enzyme [Umezawaea sp.]